MSASPSFKLSSDGGATFPLASGVALADANALAYNAGGSYAIKAQLASGQDLSRALWAFSGIDDANVGAPPVITTSADTQSCTFSVPKQGGAWLLTCTATDGKSSSIAALAIKVRVSTGQQVLAIGEGYEASTAWGWIKAINDSLRGTVISATATKGTIKIVVPTGAGTTDSAFVAPAGSVIDAIDVTLETAYTNADTITIGTPAAPGSFVSAADLDGATPGSFLTNAGAMALPYVKPFRYGGGAVGTLGASAIRVVKTGSSAGRAIVLVSWSIPST